MHLQGNNMAHGGDILWDIAKNTMGACMQTLTTPMRGIIFPRGTMVSDPVQITYYN